MIVKGLYQLIYSLLNGLFVFDLPNMPTTIVTLWHEFVSYVITGIDVIRIFVGDTAMGVFALLLSLIIGMNVAYFVIGVIFFVLRKIPIAGVNL